MVIEIKFFSIMSQQIFPQLQALLQKVDDVLDAVKPVITFSVSVDRHVRFWKVNYPKGQGVAKAEFLSLILDKFMSDSGVYIDNDGRVKPLIDEKKR